MLQPFPVVIEEEFVVVGNSRWQPEQYRICMTCMCCIGKGPADVPHLTDGGGAGGGGGGSGPHLHRTPLHGGCLPAQGLQVHAP